MRCHMPFEDDDPMLPSQHPKFGDCEQCGYAHRLDLGCCVELRPSQDDSANVVAWCVAGGIVIIIAAMIVQAVC